MIQATVRSSIVRNPSNPSNLSNPKEIRPMKKTLQRLVLTFVAAVLTSPAAFAANYWWVGGQEPDGTDASQLSNWNLYTVWPPVYTPPSVLPGSGDSVTFNKPDAYWGSPTTPATYTLNLTEGMSFHQLGFSNPHPSTTIGSTTDKSLTLGAGGMNITKPPSGGSNVFNVDIKLAANQMWDYNSGQGSAVNTYIFNNEVHTEGHTLTLRRTGSDHSHEFKFNGPITGTGKVVVTNNTISPMDDTTTDKFLKVYLDGDNTYSGGTEIEYGRVLLGGTLRGNIEIGGDPLAKAGTWVIATGSLAGISAANPGTLVFAANGGAYDQVIVYDEGTLDITNLNLDLAAIGAGFTEREYILIDLQGGSLIGTEFASVTGLPAGYWLEYDYSDGLQVALLIPEPTSLALLGLASLGVLRRRRR